MIKKETLEYTLYINDDKYKLPYCTLTQKVKVFKTDKSFKKLLNFYKKKRRDNKEDLKYKYRSDKSTRTIYRAIDERFLTFDEKKQNIEEILNYNYDGMRFEDYLNEERNWSKHCNKKILNCMGNYLLLGECEDGNVLTQRQIRYINETEQTVDFSETYEEDEMSE